MRTSLSKNTAVSGTLLSSILAISLTLSSCGNSPENKIVTNAHVSTYTNDGDIYGEFSATLDLGNMMLPSITFPINNPKSGEQVGELSLLATMTGESEISVAVNVSAVANLQGNSAPRLPNGTAIPVGGIYDSQVIELPVANSATKIYLALGDKVAMIGVAVSIKELDSIGTSIGGVNLFPRFNIGGVVGIAGIFTGTTSGTSGIALFADMSKVINPSDIVITKTKSLNLIKSAGNVKSNLIFIDQAPSKSTKNKLYKKLNSLNSRTRILTIN